MKKNNSPTWQQSLSQAVTNPKQLCELLHLNFECIENKHFPLRVPLEFIARMEKGNPKDPLLLQVLTTQKEFLLNSDETQDPVSDQKANPIPGLLHKYHGRLLLTPTGACAIHCRYCFRQHFPYADNAAYHHLDNILNYIREDSSIEEVILSGGDPLVVKDEPIKLLINQLEKIDHVKRLRIHTRLPIVIPHRITEALIGALTQTRLQPIVVIHCNHPNEIDDNVREALKKMHKAGITLLNQSVLLKDVNDNAEVLVALCKQLFEAKVLPYYLHQLDRVQGSSHFFVPEERAKELMQTISKQLPGYLVPKLVQEIAGLPAKSLVFYE